MSPYRRLSRAMRDALAMIKGADPGEAYLVVCESFIESGSNLGNPWTQAFINFRTAQALEQRGLIRVSTAGVRPRRSTWFPKLPLTASHRVWTTHRRRPLHRDRNDPTGEAPSFDTAGKD